MKYSFTTTIGIDVSKLYLDVFCHGDGSHKQFENTPEDITKIIKWIKQRAEEALVIIEPTGGYERILQQIVLTTKGMHMAKVNARQIREFARAKGQIAKTDKIDASILAEYGIAMHPRILTLAPEYRQELCAMVSRKRQLTDSITREKTRLGRAVYDFAKQSIKDVIAFLRQQVRELDVNIREVIKSHSELKEAHQILKNVTGIGPITVGVLLAELPELGRIGNKAISNLVGVAPHNIDSGTMRGQRHIYGGRKNVRNALYMATLSAVRHHETISKFYQNLILRGKKPKVAIVAAMRKLIIILNAKMRDHYAQIA